MYAPRFGSSGCAMWDVRCASTGRPAGTWPPLPVRPAGAAWRLVPARPMGGWRRAAGAQPVLSQFDAPFGHITCTQYPGFTCVLIHIHMQKSCCDGECFFPALDFCQRA
jgi:hypothetical protein